jgi:hypothetical protein
MTPPATCAPPEEHAHHEWHWLLAFDEDPVPMKWDNLLGEWVRCGKRYKPDDLWDWRYVGPAIPPASEPA